MPASPTPTTSTSPSSLFPRCSAITPFQASGRLSHQPLITVHQPSPSTDQPHTLSPLMAPLVQSHHPSQLQSLVQTKINNKPHKPPFDLQSDCELKEMVQYFCDLSGPREDPRSRVVCEPCLRLFRV